MGLKHVVSETGGTVFSLPYFVARDEGYFVEEGIDIEFVKRGAGANDTRSVQLVDNRVTVLAG